MLICKMYIDTYNNEECLVIEVDEKYKERDNIKNSQIAISKEVLSTISKMRSNYFSMADMIAEDILTIYQGDGRLHINKKDETKIIYPIDKIKWESDYSSFNPVIMDNEYLKNTPLREFMFSSYELDKKYVEFIISYLTNTTNYTISRSLGSELSNSTTETTYEVNGNMASHTSSYKGYVLEVIKDHICYSSEYTRDSNNKLEVTIKEEKTDKNDFSLKNMIDKDIMGIILNTINPEIDEKEKKVHFKDDKHNSVTCYLGYNSIIKISYSWMTSGTYGEPGHIDYHEYIDYDIYNENCTEVDLRDDVVRAFKEKNIID